MNKTFESLASEVTELHFKWIVFRNVYAIDQEHIKLLNEIDSCFFGTVQNIYWDSIILNISKLIDPSMTGSNHNLTIYRLWSEYEDSLSLEDNEELNKISLRINEVNKKLKNHRSKRLAHLDYNYGINKDAFNLGGISRVEIEEMLKLIRDFPNKIHSEIDDTTTMYEGIIGIDGGEKLYSELKKMKSSWR